MRLAFVAVMVCCFMACGSRVFGAGVIDEPVRQANAALWGANQDRVRSGAPSAPVVGNKTIMLAAATLAGRQAAVNYLFDKQGGLYNIAWYVLTPVDDFESARALDQTLEMELRAKYGKPAYTFSDGDPAGAEKVKAIPMAERPSMKTMENFLLSPKPGPGGKKAGDAPSTPKPDIMSLMPSVFYSKLLFWDTGKTYVYINFIASTDGLCYQHFQFVSKERTKKTGYSPQFKAFTASPLDRDQDLVVAIYKAWTNNEPVDDNLKGTGYGR